jgi:hypothetical protein
MSSSPQGADTFGALTPDEQQLVQAIRTGSPADIGTAFAKVLKNAIAAPAAQPVEPPRPAAQVVKEPRERIIVQRLGWLEINHMPVDGTPKHARLLRFVVADRWALDIVIWFDFWHVTVR